MLVGRERERKALEELYQSDSAELVALYGRRRVGKTFLVDETFSDRITFRHAGLSPLEDRDDADTRRAGRMANQLRHFHRSLQMQGLAEAKLPTSWLEAFYLLEDLLARRGANGERSLVFLDEIQWLDTPRSGFMTGFEAFWNGWACHRHNVMVIVCGSSSSWVLDKLIGNHGGLYGRVTYQMCLAPFTLNECERLLESRGVVMSRYDIVQAYMMVGGIPYYLRYFKRGLSLAQNVNAMFFAGQSPLKDEFDRLFSSLFANPKVMASIVEALNTKARGLTRAELLEKTGISDSGEFSRHLKALITGAFVTKYYSYGNGRRESFYKLTDPFCLFWLRFVRDSQAKSTSWVNMSDSQTVVTWRGYAFENVCWNHVPQIKAALGISGVLTSESLWSKRATEGSRGTQIDLIIDRKDNVINMCEAKFTADEFSVDRDYHFTLVRRTGLLRELIPKRAVIHNTLITTYGLRYNAYSGDFVSVVTMDDLFG